MQILHACVLKGAIDLCLSLWVKYVLSLYLHVCVHHSHYNFFSFFLIQALLKQVILLRRAVSFSSEACFEQKFN